MHTQTRSLLFLLWLAIVSGQTTIYQQNFDSLSSSPCQLPPSPVQSSDINFACVTNVGNPGNSAVTKQSSSITIPISTSNYFNLTLSFSTQAITQGPGRNCSFVEYTVDGFLWYTIREMCNNSNWVSTTFKLPIIAENNPVFAIRLRSFFTNTASSSCNLDNINLIGYPGTGTGVLQNGIVDRTILTSAYLYSTNIPTAPVPTSEFYLPPTAALGNSSLFLGTLSLNSGSLISLTGNNYNVITDTYLYMSPSYANANDMLKLPEFSFDFYSVNINGVIHSVPVSRGLNTNTAHKHYEYILSPGRIWYEVNDGNDLRVTIGVSLSQKNANCIHNGMMTFLFNSGSIKSASQIVGPTQATISKAFLEITSETCSYFKANYWGLFNAAFTLKNLDIASQASSYIAEVSQRIPLRPFYMLPVDNPTSNLNIQNFGNGITQSSLSLYALSGWQYQNADVTYVSYGPTRYGSYPLVDSFILPSYSIAKEILVAISMMSLVQNLNSDSFLSKPLSSYCTPYSSGTLKNALNMATGYYSNSGYETDENSTPTSNNFYLVSTNDQKMFKGQTTPLGSTAHPNSGTACGYGSTTKSTPGTYWVYHTSDYYLSTRILEDPTILPATYSGSISNFWNSIVASPVKLSPLIQCPRTTTDGKVWGGWGLFMYLDDISKIANFINNAKGIVSGSQILSSTYLNKVMQRDSTDVGLTVPNLGSTHVPLDTSNPFTYRFNYGMWATNAFNSQITVPNYSDYIPSGGYPCTDSTNTPNGKNKALSGYYTPFSSGFGGISIAYLPNRLNFMVFSDNNEFIWVPGARETIKLKNFCDAGLY